MRKLANRILALGILLAMLPFFSHAEEISPRQLLEVVDFSLPVVSPDGSSIAFRVEQASIERNTYDSYWYVQRVEGDASPRRVADGGAPLRDTAGVSLPATVVWSPEGRWIYYRARIDGRIDVWRAATDGSSAEPVTRDPADVRDFGLTDDGGTLKYSVGGSRERIVRAEQVEYDRGIRIDETVPIGQGLFRSGNVEGRLETQRYTGLWFDRAGLLATEPDHWKALDLETRAVRNLVSSDRPPPLAPFDLARGVPEPWKLSLDPGTGRIALLTRVGNGEGLISKRKPDVQLAMLPNKTANKPILCVAELCTNKAISGVQWRPNSDDVLFTVTDPAEGFAQSIYSWNVQTGVVRLVIRAKGLLSGGRDPSSPCGLSSVVFVCVTAAADQPPRLERIDFESGKRHVLFDPNADLAADMRRTVQPQLLRWSDGAGHHFTGQFFPARHTGHGPSPLFVNYYDCGGFLRGGVGDEWPFASLAEDGVSALCINHGPWLADAVARYNEGLSAVKSAVDLLALQGKIDRTSVGMGGLSFGSEVALWAAAKSDLLTAVSVTSPTASPLYYLLNSLKGRSLAVGLKNVWQLGSPEEAPKRWRILSPAYSVDKFHTPLLLQMPEQEYLYSLDYVIPLLLDKRADLYVFPNEPHQKFQPKHKLAAYERNLDWFRFWLQGYEDPSLDKRVQYEHWHVLRDRKRR